MPRCSPAPPGAWHVQAPERGCRVELRGAGGLGIHSCSASIGGPRWEGREWDGHAPSGSKENGRNRVQNHDAFPGKSPTVDRAQAGRWALWGLATKGWALGVAQ